MNYIFGKFSLIYKSFPNVTFSPSVSENAKSLPIADENMEFELEKRGVIIMKVFA